MISLAALLGELGVQHEQNLVFVHSPESTFLDRLPMD